jgi:acetolactate synthase-1/2/3 large subunit
MGRQTAAQRTRQTSADGVEPGSPVQREMALGRCLAEMIDGYGVSHVFLVPAIANRTLAEMEDHTSVGRVITHGEKAAAYMSDGYARASQKPGVCLAQEVGCANLAAGLRDAWLAASPIVAITGGPDDASRGRHQYQQANDFAVFEPLTKFSEMVTTASRLPDLLRQAFRVATTGRPGPVHLQLKGNLGQLDEEVAQLSVDVEERFSRIPAFRGAPELELIERAAQMLADSERPVLVAGGGVRASNAGAELVALAERLSVPVATSLDGKDTIPSDHRLCCGVTGSYSRKSANRVVLEADLVFYVGSAMGSQTTFNWALPNPHACVIQLDIDPEQLGRHRTAVLPLACDAKVGLRLLHDHLTPVSATDRAEWLDQVAAIKADWQEDHGRILASDSVPLRPERLCAELSAVLPADALLVADTGHAGMWTGQMVDLTRPGQRYLRAAGSLGWALPAGIGAKLAVGDKPVVIFGGDGAAWYHIGELETAVRNGAGVVVVINNNNSLNQEIGLVKKAYGGALRGRHGELWKFTEVDFARVAESMGAKGYRVTRPDELERTLSSAIDEAGSVRTPVILDVVTDITAVAPLAYAKPAEAPLQTVREG